MSIPVALALLGAARAEPPPAPTPPAAQAPTGASHKVLDQQAPLMRMQLESGFARWVTQRDAPNTFYTHRGPMTVDLYADWIVIRTKEGAAHIVPREFVVYVGSLDLDAL